MAVPYVLSIALGEAPGTEVPTRTWPYDVALPAVVGMFVLAFGWRLPLFRTLFAEPHPMAILDGSGLELYLPRVGVRRFAWEDVEGLRPRRNGPGELLGVDGSVLAMVPSALIASGRPNLARSVVAIRPDRYVRDRGWLGRASGGFSRAPASGGR